MQQKANSIALQLQFSHLNKPPATYIVLLKENWIENNSTIEIDKNENNYTDLY